MANSTALLLLAAPGDAGAMLLVAVIVAIVMGSMFLLYFALVAPSQKAGQIAEHSAAFEGEYDNSGPVRRYPPTGADYLPAAVAELGEPRFVHRFESFAEQCHLGWLFGSGVDRYPTYVSYRSALVVVTPDSYTVIPWEEITEFLHTVGFKASNEQKFVIGPDFTNYGELSLRLESEILTSQLPKALAAVEAGQEWCFSPFTEPTAGSGLLAAFGQPQLEGPLAVSKSGLRYKDQSIAWSDVASIQVTRHLYHGALCRTTLAVRKKWGMFPALQFDFQAVANSFLLTELLPYVCPEHLLVTAGSQAS